MSIRSPPVSRTRSTIFVMPPPAKRHRPACTATAPPTIRTPVRGVWRVAPRAGSPPQSVHVGNRPTDETAPGRWTARVGDGQFTGAGRITGAGVRPRVGAISAYVQHREFGPPS